MTSHNGTNFVDSHGKKLTNAQKLKMSLEFFEEELRLIDEEEKALKVDDSPPLPLLKAHGKKLTKVQELEGTLKFLEEELRLLKEEEKALKVEDSPLLALLKAHGFKG